MIRRDRAEERGDLKRLAKIEAELALPLLPTEVNYIWRAYLRMRRRVLPGFAGPNPISWQDMSAYVQLTGQRLSTWEVGLIEKLDDVFLLPEPKPTAPEGQTVKAAAAASDAEGVRSILGSFGVRRVVRRNKGGDK